MVFVPEGQHDSSQARSAWNHQENSPVPAGRLNRSDLYHPFSGNGSGHSWASTVPPGTGPLCIATQALRAWLLSACPSGTKAIRLSKRLIIILALNIQLGDSRPLPDRSCWVFRIQEYGLTGLESGIICSPLRVNKLVSINIQNRQCDKEFISRLGLSLPQ
jgi:hypothetical protein